MSGEERPARIPHWSILVCILQTLVNVVVVVMFFQIMDGQKGSEQKWTYFSAINGITIVALSLNLLLSKENIIRHCTVATSIILFTFLAPLTLVSSGYPPTLALQVGMLYVMLIICSTPLYIASLAFVAGGAFSLSFAPLSGMNLENFYRPLLAFLVMTAIAMLWRALLMKLLLGYMHLQSYDAGESGRLNHRIQDLEEERTLLRGEIITHVVELNEAVLNQNQQIDTQEGQ